jgi:CheY-like chemotaxis protein
MPVRVLVVDDDDAIRELVAEILRDEGYEVTQARNGAVALEHLGSGAHFELIVLDMRMPLMDGWQFAAELDRRGLAVPIVVMTAAQNARRWAEEIGAAGYIAKPFSIDDLLEAARTASHPESPAAPAGDALVSLARARAQTLFHAVIPSLRPCSAFALGAPQPGV